MSEAKERVPAIEGWFSLDAAAPHLIGTRCTSCRSFFFPKETYYCRNPYCDSSEFDEVPLSRTGRVWSWTTNLYQPPEPYLSPDPFVPYTVAAVELDEEKMVILGQLATGVEADALSAGAEVELVLETLYEDDANEYLVWKWKPTAA